MYSVSTSSWKSRLLVPRRSKMDKPLSSCMLAVAPVRAATGGREELWDVGRRRARKSVQVGQGTD